MRCVITGATSMIGISLINSCLRNDSEVLAIVRKNTKNINRIPKSSSIRIVECNLDNMSTLKFDDKKYDVFFHLGWEGTDRINRYDIDVQTLNIQYSLDAVKLAKNLGCNTFVGIGSQAEYGAKNSQLSVNMSTNPTIPYGTAKLCAYYVTKQVARILNIRHIWIRVLSVYGRYESDDTLIQYLLRSLKNKQNIYLTECKQIWDFLYCDDAGDALYSIGKNGKNNKIYNLSSGDSRVLKEYVEIIKKIINPSAIICYGSKEYPDNQITNLSADIEEITKDTGWKPKVSFEEGVRRIYRLKRKK